jgi:hypothetical protein
MATQEQRQERAAQWDTAEGFLTPGNCPICCAIKRWRRIRAERGTQMQDLTRRRPGKAGMGRRNIVNLFGDRTWAARANSEPALRDRLSASRRLLVDQRP